MTRSGAGLPMADPTPIRADAVAGWPEPPAEAAYHGLAGEIVRALDPHTEADPVGVLVTLLAGFGNAIGRRPHLVLDNKRHPLLVWPVLVGPTGIGRKGTALAVAGRIFERALPLWWDRRESSLATGEGLIHRVRDPQVAREPIKVKGRVTDYQEVVTDQGVEDKRLYVAATEFGSVLQVMGRDRNILSAILRNAWDGDPLGNLTKTSAAKATGAHIAVNGHVTPEEVRDLLSAGDAANGFANRFLWACVRRSKLLPLGSDANEGEIAMLGDLFARTVEDASQLDRLRLDEGASAMWVRVYDALATRESGVVGQLLSRAEPMVQRLAGLYAALDVSATIGVPHLEAALALWGYCEASVGHIFGPQERPAPASTGSAPYIGNTILDALATGEMTQTEIADLFDRNLRAPEPLATLNALLDLGHVARRFDRPASGRGRNTTLWRITDAGKGARKI
jgi:hypothetical protein